MKIGGKLTLGFIGVACLTAAVGLIGLVSVRTLGKADTLQYEDTTVPIGQLLLINSSVKTILIDIRDMTDITGSGAEYVKIDCARE